MRFTTVVELGGKTATGLPVPAEVVASFGTGRRYPVVVTLNGYSYRTTVTWYGGQFMVPLAAEHREAAGVAANQEVEVDIELDTAPRDVDLPGDLAAARSPGRSTSRGAVSSSISTSTSWLAATPAASLCSAANGTMNCPPYQVTVVR